MINLSTIPSFEHTTLRIVSLDSVFIGWSGQYQDFISSGLIDAAESVEIPPELWLFWSKPSQENQREELRRFYSGNSRDDAFKQAFIIKD